MAKTPTLKIETPVGEFTRKTSATYTHVVVRISARAKASYDERGTLHARARTGVAARWIKDRGYATTWHGSEAAARKAAAAPYGWDGSNDVVGVFPVTNQEG